MKEERRGKRKDVEIQNKRTAVDGGGGKMREFFVREGGKPNCRPRNESAFASEKTSQSSAGSIVRCYAMALIKYARPPLKATLLVMGMLRKMWIYYVGFL